jgi:hypothetical protein
MQNDRTETVNRHNMMDTTGKDNPMNRLTHLLSNSIIGILVFVALVVGVGQSCLAQEFTMVQTLSDQAQSTTLAFDGLAFITGSLGSDSFFPPGKVADFWGFQYLRDNDPSRMGHNTDFLTRASGNMLYVLTPAQLQQLLDLANNQVSLIDEYGTDRFVLMKAFRRLLEGDVPAGTTGLNRSAVMAYSAELYKLDGRMCYERARIMGGILRALTTQQKSHLDSLVGTGMATWPVVPDPPAMQGLSPRVKEAVMTYAGDMFSWYSGTIDADVYFCPERQATYFGSFYMKDAPAVGNPGYAIDTNATAGYGKKFLEALSPAASQLASGIVDLQRPYLYELVDRRLDISTELRKFRIGITPDSLLVISLMDRYGQLDGEIIYHAATAFAAVNSMLTSIQRDTLNAYRSQLLGTLSHPSGAYLYATPIDMPVVPNTDFLFSTAAASSYPVVGTGQSSCFNDSSAITPPMSGKPYYGQDAQSLTNLPSYHNNGDHTISDLVTGLTWQSTPDVNGNNNGTIEKADKLTWSQIQARLIVLNSSNWGGHNDWRIPTIQELYSLTNFNGTDPSGYAGTTMTGFRPFIDTANFPFAYGQVSSGERIIDVQYASRTLYNELSFAGYQQLFGFNFADGRIKGYDLTMPGGADKVFSFIAVRGNTSYGVNHFIDNGNLTITDSATGLMWMKDDSKTAMNWAQALAWAQAKDSAGFCGHNDWRLPTAKELQSIVDYTRSPGSTSSAAISPLFNCTPIVNEAGATDWPWFWTGTTHESYDGSAYHGSWAVYVCFGRAAGWIQKPGNSYYSYCDVHGAGAQRSSPKSGTYLGDYMGLDSLGHAAYGLGPQGDVLRINNFVRLVRNLETATLPGSGSVGGTLFFDANQNGVADAGEQPVSGWMVHLTGPTNDSVLTNGSGMFAFSRLDSGVYHISITGKPGWSQTAPASPDTVLTIAASTATVNFGIFNPTARYYNVKNGWNLISLPQTGIDTSAALLFPTAVSPAFIYGTCYTTISHLVSGVGYWLKFSSDQGLFLLGETQHTDTVGLNAGWNLIGAPGAPCPAASIVSDTPGVVFSGIFGYSGRYIQTDTLRPFAGYWIKSNMSCRIILNPGTEMALFKTALVITGELPPAPPEESGPVPDTKPSAFALMQNYPNPFNPVTTIRYQIPVTSLVRIAIYNVLGQVVAVVYDGQENAGTYSVEWNASNMASGVYFYHLTARDPDNAGTGFSQVKKMLLVR